VSLCRLHVWSVGDFAEHRLIQRVPIRNFQKSKHVRFSLATVRQFNPGQAVATQRDLNRSARVSYSMARNSFKGVATRVSVVECP